MAKIIKQDENGTLYETVATPKSNIEFMRAVLLALGSENVTKRAVCLLTAKSILECGVGWKKMFGNCLGNVKYLSPHPNGKYQMLRNVFEFINGKRVTFQPPHRQTWFRYYETLEEAMVDYIKLLKSKPSYQRAFDALMRGDPEGYVLALHAGHYFTASPDVYLGSVKSIFNGLMNSDAFEIAMETRNDLDPVIIFADEV